MDEKKKGIIFGIIALVAGIAMISYGVINLMGNREETPNRPNENENNNGNTDGPSISVSEDDVRTWLTDNAAFIDYFVTFNHDLDLDTATEADISNIFGWYFVQGYNHGDGEKPTDSKYKFRYKMPKTDADTFIQNYLGVPLDMVNLQTINVFDSFGKDSFKFTSDDENFYVDITDYGFGGNLTSEISKIDILSDSEIKVTYGILDNTANCDSTKENCYTKTRELTLRKADSGFTILRANDSSAE